MTVAPPTPEGTLLSYDDAVSRYEPVIGLETHVELGTQSKMFCGCPTAFGAEPNTQVCPVCLGLPGSLPVVNEAAVRFAAMIGLALHCSIAPYSRFARKNYFYPDMPKDYQISQYDEPLCVDGYLDVEVATPEGPQSVRVAIERVHLEEDTGKTLHVGGATGRIHGATHSLVDYNRAGIPLVEIVTRPVEAGRYAPEVARAYVTELRELLLSLGVSDVRMEQGSLRCDANLSLRRPGQPYGTRTETKNVNSLRSVERAVRHEVQRQAAILEAGGRIRQETRHFQEGDGTTKPGRSKEEATDYRYFPEPDLVPLAPTAEWVEELRAGLPELPAERRRRMTEEYGYTSLDLEQMRGAGVLELVQETVAAGASPDAARSWWMNDLAARANEAGLAPGDLGISPAEVAQVVELVGRGTLTAALAREAVGYVVAGEGTVDQVVAARSLAVVQDDAAIAAAVDAALAAEPGAADKVRGGDTKALGPLLGHVMKATQKKADARAVRQLLLERLGQA
ncbi:MAG: gatB [Mycobacterium sp.]|jgi:aspartyl-tRNA(Asn)/glutamyl-tRNA(Gln) amidotransferase subunit B|nr:gatB [Mycobacterium sp.]